MPSPISVSRFYLGAVDDPPIAPAYGLSAAHAWTTVGAARRAPLLFAKNASESLVRSDGFTPPHSGDWNTTNGGTGLILQLISERPLAAQTIPGTLTITGLVAAQQQQPGDDVQMWNKVYVVSADGSTRIGAIFDLSATGGHGTGSYLHPSSSLVAETVADGTLLIPGDASFDVPAGSYFVWELGIRSSTQYFGLLLNFFGFEYGAPDSLPDFTAAGQAGESYAPWLQLSAPLLFEPAPEFVTPHATPDITDHCARAINRLAAQFQTKHLITTEICIWGDEVQEVEQAITDVAAYRSLDTAYGVGLDHIGALLDLPRGGLSDDVYRTRLRAKALVASSRGTPNEIEAILTMLDDGYSTGAMRYYDLLTKTAMVTCLVPVAHILTRPLEYIRILRQAKPASYRLILRAQPNDTTPPILFTMGEDGGSPIPDGSGMAEEGSPTMGGLMLEAVDAHEFAPPAMG